MRILAVADELDPHGGQERSQLEVSAGLAARGHAVDLVYRSPGAFLERYAGFTASMHQVPILRGQRGAGSSWPRLVATAARASRYGRAADVVYLNDDRHSVFGAALTTLPSRPLVCHLRLPVSAARTRQDRIGLRAVDRFIAVSDHTRTAYVEDGMGAERVEVVHNGIDPARFPLATADNRAAARTSFGLDHDAFVVAYVGRLDPAKGIETLLEAWRRLDIPPPHGQLLLAGGPRNHRTMEEATAYVDGLKAATRPETSMWLDRQADVVPVYHAADVVVLPSVFEEPFGRVLVEAMACGRPAVASAVGGIPEVLTGELSRFLVPPTDGAALEAVLRSLQGWQFADPDLGQRARAHVEANFTVDHTVDGVAAVLEGCVARA